jgi:co-chaperonin GroES (HSP10)
MSDLIDARKIRPLHSEFLCVRTRKPKQENSLIYTPDDAMDDSAGTTFTVLRVGPQCRELQEGDTIVIKFQSMTPPFLASVDGEEKMVAIGPESSVLAILTGD